MLKKKIENSMVFTYTLKLDQIEMIDVLQQLYHLGCISSHYFNSQDLPTETAGIDRTIDSILRTEIPCSLLDLLKSANKMMIRRSKKQPAATPTPTPYNFCFDPLLFFEYSSNGRGGPSG